MNLVRTDSTPSLIFRRCAMRKKRSGTRVERVPTRSMVPMRDLEIVEATQDRYRLELLDRVLTGSAQCRRSDLAKTTTRVPKKAQV